MADGTCGVSRSRAAASYAEEACGDEKAGARSSDEARKRVDAEAESRSSRYYTSDACSPRPDFDAGSCGPGGGSFGKSITTQAAQLQARTAEEKARIDSAVHPYWKPDTLDRLGDEILRLRALVPAPADTALENAIAARVTELSSDWCAKARAAGMSPPTASFSPYGASDRALQGAFLWMTVAGVVPLDAASHDGGLEFREDVFEAIALRTPGLGDQLIDSYAGDPGTQRVLLERELYRLGQPMCSAADTNEQLVVRRAELLRHRDALVNAVDPMQRTIGLDGLQGTLQSAVDYEIEQRVLAMNPGSSAGIYYASLVAVRGGSIEDIRAAGEAGNALEGFAGALAGVDQTKIGRRAPPGTMGRRRTPPGPGLGRRTRVAQSRTRAARPSGPETRAGVTERANAASARPRTPVAFDDKHVLGGEVKLSPSGAPRAVGFHSGPRYRVQRQDRAGHGVEAQQARGVPRMRRDQGPAHGSVGEEEHAVDVLPETLDALRGANRDPRGVLES